MNYLLSLGIMCLGIETLCAQSDGDVQKLPPGPWPARAPAMSTWIVKIDQQRGATPNRQNIAQDSSNGESDTTTNSNVGPQQMITVVKTWPVVHETAIDFKGLKWDKWFANEIEVALTPSTGQAIISTSVVKDSFLFQDYSKSDFSDLDWLAADDYKEKGDCDGVLCFIFEGKMITNPMGPPTLVKNGVGTIQNNQSAGPGVSPYTAHEFTVRAYLDCKTLLPRKLEYGDEIRTYTFGEPPTSRQVLPTTVTDAIAESRKATDKCEMKPDRPF